MRAGSLSVNGMFVMENLVDFPCPKCYSEISARFASRRDVLSVSEFLAFVPGKRLDNKLRFEADTGGIFIAGYLFFCRNSN